jgi:hypothetical protein
MQPGATTYGSNNGTTSSRHHKQPSNNENKTDVKHAKMKYYGATS